jgi:hypothetical protein
MPPIPPNSFFNKELVNVPVQLLYSRRKLFEKIVANLAKRKIQNSIQATGDRMAATPQQFGMQIGQQIKKSFLTGASIGALGGLATSKPGERALGAGRGALIGGGTELGAVGGLGMGSALGGLSGATLGALLGNPAAGAGLGMLAGGAAGGVGGGMLGHMGTKAILDSNKKNIKNDKSDSSNKSDKKDTKEDKRDDADEKEAALRRVLHWANK